MNNIATQAKLDMLKDLGFVFRIPGGSSRTGSHSSYALIPRFSEGDAQLLVVPYNPSVLFQRKYDEEEFDEDPKGALELKTLEQTGVRIPEYHLVGEQVAKNNRQEVKRDKHIKHVFYIDVYDDSNIRDVASPDKRLDPPLWVPVDLLEEYLCPQHKWILELFFQEIAPRLCEH